MRSILSSSHRYLKASGALVLVLLLTLISRLYNLNYNVPFNDEAIYIVVGKFGLFQKDWVTYAADSWMAGSQYAYPVMAALAAQWNGVVGSRLLNVIFGVLLVEISYVITYQIAPGTTQQRKVAGLISAVLVGGSAIGYYVSRLATYDMPSFYFMFLSIALVILASNNTKQAGRIYFFAALCLILSFLTKIVVAMYVPFIFLYALYKARMQGQKMFQLWKWYFAAPLVLFFVTWTIQSVSNIKSFTSDQIIEREKAPYSVVAETYFGYTLYVWLFWLIGSVGLLKQKLYKHWIVLTSAALLIFVVHLAGKRLPTFDKHMYISVPFLAAVAGIGISILLYSISLKFMRQLSYALVGGLLALYSIVSFIDAQEFNAHWLNTSKGLTYLQSHIKLGDKVLAEVGASAILATYNTNYPHNIYTFDFLEYERSQGVDAYRKAVEEGFFDVIQVQEEPAKMDKRNAIRSAINSELKKNYYLEYQEDNFFVYRKKVVAYE